MKKNLYIIACVLLLTQIGFAQTKPLANKQQTGNTVSRPKLVVGIVVDQMRWDFLYRYYNRFGAGGFKRLLTQGFSCENTFINYIPAYTAVGHSTIFSGSVPAISGIAGNDWVDQISGKTIYCTSDSSVQSVGIADSPEGRMSPRNMLVTTITDELRLATNFNSKVIGVSLKDRASILPAGHLGEAFWMDDNSGNFITSTYYSTKLPSWVTDFNAQKRIDALLENGWKTIYPIETYTQSTTDNVSWEGAYKGSKSPTFPYDLKTLYQQKKISIRPTPFGNSITLEFATAAVKANELGKGNSTDFLTINCASTDYVGHQFGPNSIEVEDTYLRLDNDLATFFTMLDAKVGKNQWLVFLTADHGAAHSIGFNQAHNVPADFWDDRPIKDTLNQLLEQKFGVSNLIRAIANYQVSFDITKIDATNIDYTAIKAFAVNWLKRQRGISFAVDVEEIGTAPIPEAIKTMITNGYNFKRSGGVQIIVDAAWFEAHGKTGTTHGTWHPYDTHIPLLWYGWGVKQGKTNRITYMTDISATLAALLHIQMPNGCIGHVIDEVSK